MNPRLASTNNSLLFIPNIEQRPINLQHVRFLESKMKKFGFLPSKPIQCYRNDFGKLVIVDGHHRLEAAKRLGIVFYYVIEESSSQEAMCDVNRGKQWGIADFIRQFCIRGLSDYDILDQYIKRGLSATTAIGLLSGYAASSGTNKSGDVKSGTFKVVTTRYADCILSLIKDNNGIEVFRNANFVKALSLALFLPEFDFGTFKGRAEQNYHMFPKCSNIADFLTSIEEVYNFRSQKKQPLAHLAKIAATKRSAATKGGSAEFGSIMGIINTFFPAKAS